MNIVFYALLALSSLCLAHCQSCPPGKEFVTNSNNPDFSGTCQVYKRGEAPCTADSTVLGEWAGWFTIFFLGMLFAIMAISLFKYEMRSKGMQMTSELFNCGGRNVGPGLTASAIVSKWTWAATLFMSTNMGWSVGLSGPFWYASGATIQILLFSYLAARVKQHASHMHTFLEVIKVRFGTTTHLIMLVFALTTNVIVTSMLLLGGAEALEYLTGMSKLVAALLIPIVACWGYALYGGLLASFLASFLHTTLIMLMLIIWTFAVFAGSGEEGLWGSPGNVHNGVTKASVHAFFNATLSEEELTPSAGSFMQEISSDRFFSGLGSIMQNDGECYDRNMQKVGKTCGFSSRGKDSPCCSIDFSALPDGTYCRKNDADCISVSKAKHFESKECDFEAGERCVTSFLTMGSTIGLIFGITNIVGNFGTVFVDQSYWQSAIASKKGISGVVGFLFGGLVWFAVPFCMATTLGMGGRALTTHTNIDGKIGAHLITASISGAGLTPAKVVAHILGGFGGFLLLLQLFSAISSTGSAEILAVSSILTYDVYYEYVNPSLKRKRLKSQERFDSALSKALARADDQSATRSIGKKYNKDLHTWTVTTTDVQAIMNELAAVSSEPLTTAQLSRLSLHLSAIAVDGAVPIEEIRHAVLIDKEEGDLLLRVSRFFTGVFAIFMSFLAMFLLALGMSLGHVYMSMGCIVGSAVGPAFLSFTMQTANGKAVGAGAVGGFCIAMLAWSLQAFSEFGEVTYDTMMSDWPWVLGNLGAILGGFFITLFGSLLWPDTDFKWEQLNERIPLVDDLEPPVEDEIFQHHEFLTTIAKLAAAFSVSVSILMILIWPAPMHLFSGIFSEGGFTVWIVMEFLWLIAAGLAIVILPVKELINAADQYLHHTDVLKLKPGMSIHAVEEGTDEVFHKVSKKDRVDESKESKQKNNEELKQLQKRASELEKEMKQLKADNTGLKTDSERVPKLQNRISELEAENKKMVAAAKAAAKAKAKAKAKENNEAFISSNEESPSKSLEPKAKAPVKPFTQSPRELAIIPSPVGVDESQITFQIDLSPLVAQGMSTGNLTLALSATQKDPPPQTLGVLTPRIMNKETTTPTSETRPLLMKEHTAISDVSSGMRSL